MWESSHLAEKAERSEVRREVLRPKASLMHQPAQASLSMLAVERGVTESRSGW